MRTLYYVTYINSSGDIVGQLLVSTINLVELEERINSYMGYDKRTILEVCNTLNNVCIPIESH
jgi:hypothetical protein